MKKSYKSMRIADKWKIAPPAQNKQRQISKDLVPANKIRGIINNETS